MNKTNTDYWIVREKETFIRRNEQQIIMNGLFIEHLKMLIPIIEKFDGKILTKRLQTAFEKVITIKHGWCSLSGNNFRIGFQGKEREFYNGNTFCGYVIDSHIQTEIIVDREYKVDTKQTLENVQRNIERTENEIATLRDCIDNFDTYAEKSQQMEKAIKEYKETVPSFLQFQIRYDKPYEF